MEPSETHKQPTFVIPMNPYEELDFVSVIVNVFIVA